MPAIVHLYLTRICRVVFMRSRVRSDVPSRSIAFPNRRVLPECGWAGRWYQKPSLLKTRPPVSSTPCGTGVRARSSMGRLSSPNTVGPLHFRLEDGVSARPWSITPVSYTHLRAHETVLDLVCR